MIKNNSVTITVSMMLTVGELKRIMQGMPDSARVRIRVSKGDRNEMDNYSLIFDWNEEV